jgi:hypothetical protein
MINGSNMALPEAFLEVGKQGRITVDAHLPENRKK